MTNLRAAAQQALEAMLNFPDDISNDMFDSIAALKAALAQEKVEPVVYNGWVLREVLFDNGEPVGHREPQHSPAALAEPVQEPAFHGFMSADGTQVDLCFTPSAPRSDGAYATAYYTAPPKAEPVQEPVGYLPAYELNRLQSGHDGRLRSAKFGTSALDGDVAVYIAPPPRPAQPQGCDHCNHPLYAATKCRVCGRVTEEVQALRSAWDAGAAAERNAILQMSREQWFKTQADFEEAIRAREKQE